MSDSVWESLLYLRDEVSLQAHLMNMELQDQWRLLEQDFHSLERKFEQLLLDKAKQIGEAEEKFYLGSEEEIKALIEGFEDLRDKHTP